jgi:hypothetical protein
MRTLNYLLMAIFLCLSVVITNLSCKKEAPTEAIATFIVGEVKLLRQNEAPRQVKYADKMASQDIIKTGKNSFFAFQVGNSAIIRITANTTVLIESMLTDNTNKLFLKQGRVIESVKKLTKSSTYEVRTPTAIAAVRGTEFGVSYNNGQSVVPVKGGIVKVQRVTREKGAVEERMIEGGTAAVITRTTSKERPVNKEETKEFASVEKITIIEDVHEKSESDLKEIQQTILHGNETAKNQKAKTEKAEEETFKTNAAGTEQDTTIWTTKRTYKTNDQIVIGFKNMPDSKYCWISVAKAGATGGDYLRYNWTYGKTDGQIVFEDLGMEPGTYEARAHFSRRKDINKRISFKVE